VGLERSHVSLSNQDTADDRAAVSIHDLYFRVVADVETTRGGIECDVSSIPCRGCSAEFVFLQQVVAPSGICEGKAREQQDGTAHSRRCYQKTSSKTSAEALAATLNQECADGSFVRILSGIAFAGRSQGHF